ncbi:MAG: polysaccharide deacetylase family protein [Candidatus Bathyarchaeota archaeon]|nr:polysaccharide deacetylase family protein [Candidatus Bathyarchaeota archaeon]
MTVFRKFLLTFDVEDFINQNALLALKMILETLQKYGLRALFFVTGHMAEKIGNYPQIVKMLKNHEIGYHSSSHSIHPTIPEYTDVESYENAYEISLERETSHINPLTGEIEGEGGIHFLKKLFYPKKIQAFRAPGMCWTPPHLEALHSLGIKYDFSTNLTLSEPVSYKGITFYPYTLLQQWNGTAYDYECLIHSILKHKVTVFDLHPTLLVNQVEWDSIYYKGNPKTLSTVPEKPQNEIKLVLRNFELLIKQIKLLQSARIVDTTPSFDSQSKDLTLTKRQIKECYETSMRWAINRFNYHPKYIQNHFYKFFHEVSHKSN